MTLRRLLTMTVLGAGLAATAAQAQPMGGGMRGGGGLGPEPGMMLPMLIRKVGLSDAQRQQVKTILNSHRPQFQTLFPQLREAQSALEGRLVSTDPVKADDLVPQVQRVADLRKQILQEGIAVAIEVRAVLTPEQLARAADLHSQMRALHEQMRKLVGEPPMEAPDE
ncbi:MAG TPA: periplasmic heavy metal sensor [Candidatus Binatia bacterium]|jgi:protein CpxP